MSTIDLVILGIVAEKTAKVHMTYRKILNIIIFRDGQK